MSKDINNNLGFQTRAVHKGNGIDKETGATKDQSQWQIVMNYLMTLVI